MRRYRGIGCTWIVLACVAIAGCSVLDTIWGKELNASYCKDHLEDSDCLKAFSDGGDDRACVSSATCKAPTSVCDVAGSMMCVQCVAPNETSACSGTSPVCETDHACHACSQHPDCPLSSACLPDGSCALATDVAYVDPVQGSGNACSLAAPCKHVSDALGTGRPYVKLTGTIDESVQINNQNVILLSAPGTQLTHTMPGVLLKVDGTSIVQILDLAITNALGGSGIGISLPAGNNASLALQRVMVTNNAGGGISASGGALTLLQSTIGGNTGVGISAMGGVVTISRSVISGNTGGGISLSGAQFDITNSFIVSNGGPSTTLGGIAIDAIGANANPPHRIDFNTISANLSPAGVNLGISCGTILTPLTFSNNIIYANVVSGGGRQIAGMNCSTMYSDIGPDGVTGTGNINADPLFVNASQGDFHLMATSPAKDMADPTATLNVDFDGDTRPQGPRSDIGADEIRQ